MNADCRPQKSPCRPNVDFIRTPKEKKEQKKCENDGKILNLILFLNSQEKNEPEPNGSFEEAKCLYKRINKYSGTSIYFVDYRLFIDNSNGQKDLDYFFVYSKSNTVKLLRRYPLSDISIEIFGGKESRKLLTPKTSQITEYQDTSTTPSKKVTGLLEEYDLGGDPFIYYKFASQNLTDLQSYYILFPVNYSSNETIESIIENTFLFQGEFSCSP